MKSKSVVNFLKRSDFIVLLNKKVRWQWHLYKDWWGTRVWKKTSEVMTPLGFKLVSGFHPAYELMRKGEFEVEETAIMIKMFDKVDIFIDVGANLGFFSCLAAMNGKHVIAFEPQQQNLKCLMRNLVANRNQEDVEVFPLALSDKPGLLALYGASGPSASLIKGWAGYSSRYSQQIPVSTLDNILGYRFVDKQLFIKIDVEGAEYAVLLGAVGVLKRLKKPIWLLEVCLEEFHPSGINPDYQNIFDLFWTSGYEAYTATDPPKKINKKNIAERLQNTIQGNHTFNYVFMDKKAIMEDIWN